MSLLSATTRLATVWVWAITALMPHELRDRQRAERRAHLWDQVEHGEAAGQTPLRTASELVRALVVGMPADIAFAIGGAALFPKSESNGEMQPNWKLFVGVIWVVVIIAIGVVMIQGPEHVRQHSHLLAVRLVRGTGGIVLFLSAARALVRNALSKNRKNSVAFGVVASSMLIGAYLVRLGLSPR
jgi:hypothetical protein